MRFSRSCCHWVAALCVFCGSVTAGAPARADVLRPSATELRQAAPRAPADRLRLPAAEERYEQAGRLEAQGDQGAEPEAAQLAQLAQLAQNIELSPRPLARLLSPLPAGSRLVAGSSVELEWQPLAERELAWTDEWEVFLSLDGGATWPVRVSQHLDREVHRFRLNVPAVPTDDARLLIRFGDERREIASLLAERLVIRPASQPIPEELALAPLAGGIPAATAGTASTALAFHRGEAALPGQSGVLAWIEGPRKAAPDASSPHHPLQSIVLHQRIAAAIVLGSHLAPPPGPRTPDTTPAETSSRFLAGPVRLAPAGALVASAATGAVRTSPVSPPDLLLQTQRLNE